MKSLLISLILTIVLAVSAYALPTQQKTTLSWSAVTTNVDGSLCTDLAGYKVYWSTTSGTYNNVKDVGNVTTINIPTVIGQLKGTYYFVVTAYDTIGNESLFSNEASGSFFVGKASPANLKLQ